MTPAEPSRIVIEKFEPREQSHILDRLLEEHKEELLRLARNGLSLGQFTTSLAKQFPLATEKEAKLTDDHSQAERQTIEERNIKIREAREASRRVTTAYREKMKRIAAEHEALRDELVKAIMDKKAFAHVAYETNTGKKEAVGFIFSTTQPRALTQPYESALLNFYGIPSNRRNGIKILHGQFVLVSAHHRQSGNNANRLLYQKHENDAIEAGYQYRITTAPSDHDVIHLLKKRHYRVLDSSTGNVSILGKELVRHERK